MAKRQQMVSFAELNEAMDEFIETTAFEVPASPNSPDPDPYPAGEPAWDEGVDTTPVKKSTTFHI